MGQHHRLKRALLKQEARDLGYKENELGELKAVMTKAEARRRFIRAEQSSRTIERMLVDMCINQAKDDICAIEDAYIVEQCRKAIEEADEPATTTGL